MSHTILYQNESIKQTPDPNPHPNLNDLIFIDLYSTKIPLPKIIHFPIKT